jgi:hypothetical protein
MGETGNTAVRDGVALKNGKQFSGYAGGEAGDLSQRRSDAEIEDKFRAMTHDALSPEGSETALRLLWRLDAVPDAAQIPAFFRFAGRNKSMTV